MKSGHSGNQPYDPPPMYSLPGQDPPVQMRDNVKASAPPLGFQVAGDQQQSPGQPIVIYSNTTMQFGPYPMRYTCPNCNAHVMTEVHSTPGALTYILNAALCLLCFPCCLIPCCVRECKDIEHRCPNCHYKLGLFKRI